MLRTAHHVTGRMYFSKEPDLYGFFLRDPRATLSLLDDHYELQVGTGSTFWAESCSFCTHGIA